MQYHYHRRHHRPNLHVRRAGAIAAPLLEKGPRFHVNLPLLHGVSRGAEAAERGEKRLARELHPRAEQR